MTPKCEKEIAEVMAKIEDVKKEVALMDAELNKFTGHHQVRESIRKGRNKLYDKQFKLEEKLSHLKEKEVSTREESSIGREARESHTFAIIDYNKSLGMTSYRKIGFSKTIQQWVEVRYDRYSSFMNNVKGCSSLANTTQVSFFELITSEEAKERMRKRTSYVIGQAGPAEVKEWTDEEVDQLFKKASGEVK